MPEGAVVRKVVMYVSSGSFFEGVQLFDSQGTKLLEFGNLNVKEKKEFNLADGERLLGIKANGGIYMNTVKVDLVFVIGWVE